MHDASTKSKNDASSSGAVRAQLASRLEQQPSCSRQNLSQSVELNEQPNEPPLPIKSLSMKSLETVKERMQRKKVEGKTSGDSNVGADEHKLALLQLNAERCRSDRWRETERQRAERLAKVAETARKRRSTETDEERMLRLRKSAERKRQRAHEGLENEISESVKRNSTLSSERLENRITVDPEHSRALTLTPSETTVTSTTDETEIGSSQQRSEYGSTTSPLMQNVTANGHLSETQRSTVEHEEGCLNENASVIDAPMIAPPEFVAVSLKDSETPLLIGNDENTSPYPYSATEASAITNENNLLTYRRNHNEEERGNNVSVNQTGSSRNATQVRQRTPRNLGIALTTCDTEENYLGLMNVSCNRCGALFFPGEAKRINGSSNICCNFGNISIDLFSDFPELIRSFYTGSSSLCKNFRDQIRSYNSALAMASMGAQMDIPRGAGPYCYRIHGQVYHYVGPLKPEQGIRPQFGQVYILDTDAAATERSGNPANSKCDATVMHQLTSIDCMVAR